MAEGVFKTLPGSSDPVEINGIGFCGADAKGGVPVETAAVRMHELQNEDGEPLTGKKLAKAAQEWAEPRGLQVVDVADVSKLREELGYPADETPTVLEQATASVREQDGADEDQPKLSSQDDPETVSDGAEA